MALCSKKEIKILKRRLIFKKGRLIFKKGRFIFKKGEIKILQKGNRSVVTTLWPVDLVEVGYAA